MIDLLGYEGKTAVVCGCTTGIGAATARLLVELGADVHGLDIVPAQGLKRFSRLDLRDPQAIEATADQLPGSIDALFNCAGVPPGPASIDVIKINFIGLRRLTELVLPRMAASGAVACVSSTGGARWSQHLASLLELLKTPSYDEAVTWCEAHPELTADGYGFSKEALIAWTLSSAASFIQRGVRINCIVPGAVQTPMLEAIEKVTPAARIDVVAQPIGRRSSPEEQAHILLMLNSAAASYVNGAVLPVDGGFMAQTTVRATGAAP